MRKFKQYLPFNTPSVFYLSSGKEWYYLPDLVLVAASSFIFAACLSIWLPITAPATPPKVAPNTAPTVVFPDCLPMTPPMTAPAPAPIYISPLTCLPIAASSDTSGINALTKPWPTLQLAKVRSKLIANKFRYTRFNVFIILILNVWNLIF